LYQPAVDISLKSFASHPEHHGSVSLQAYSTRRDSACFDYDVAKIDKLFEFCKAMFAMCT